MHVNDDVIDTSIARARSNTASAIGIAVRHCRHLAEGAWLRLAGLIMKINQKFRTQKLE
jgi:hypothetical protein